MGTIFLSCSLMELCTLHPEGWLKAGLPQLTAAQHLHGLKLMVEKNANWLLSFGGISQITAGLLFRAMLMVSIQLFQTPRELW